MIIAKICGGLFDPEKLIFIDILGELEDLLLLLLFNDKLNFTLKEEKEVI